MIMMITTMNMMMIKNSDDEDEDDEDEDDDNSENTNRKYMESGVNRNTPLCNKEKFNHLNFLCHGHNNINFIIV